MHKMNDKPYHIPVLLNALLDNFQLHSNSVIVDGTLGFAGHASAILQRFPNIVYMGFDKDGMAIQESTRALNKYANVKVYHRPYSTMFNELNKAGVAPTHILLDLGVSSYQIDASERGFTFQKNEPLDMRMDALSDITATDVLNTYSLDDLTILLKSEADLKQASSLVAAIDSFRSVKPFETTFDLLTCIKQGIRMKSRRHYIAMATRIFQAIRIEVNQEMLELDKFLNGLLNLRNVTVAIITFQPNEDSKVKQFVKRHDILPLTKKPIQSSYHECKKNPREKTAKLRIFQIQ